MVAPQVVVMVTVTPFVDMFMAESEFAEPTLLEFV